METGSTQRERVEAELTDTDLDVHAWQREIHAWAVGKGWWDRPFETEVEMLDFIAGKLLMAHAEVSEAAEELRRPLRSPASLLERLRRYYLDDEGKPCGFGIELADAIIRILDLAEFVGVRVGVEMRRKMEYNAHRPQRHGGKLL